MSSIKESVVAFGFPFSNFAAYSTAVPPMRDANCATVAAMVPFLIASRASGSASKPTTTIFPLFPAAHLCTEKRRSKDLRGIVKTCGSAFHATS